MHGRCSGHRVLAVGTAIVCLIPLLLVSVVYAQEEPEPGTAVPDSQPTAQVKSGVVQEKSAGTAVLLSFLIPGGGQAYTGRWWKACLIAPVEVTLGVLSVKDHLSAVRLLRAGDEEGYVTLRNRRNVFLWWTGAVLAFSMADAYVSARMYGFDRQMQFTLGPGRAGLAVAW